MTRTMTTRQGDVVDQIAKQVYGRTTGATEALLNAIPTTDTVGAKELSILEGDIPSPVNPPKGCKFHTRCKYCTEICTQVVPEWEEVRPNHFVACHHKLEVKE